MTAHLTAAEARALGIDTDADRAAHVAATQPRRTRRALPGHGVSACHTCGEAFTSDAAETRHVAATFHARYDTDPVVTDTDDASAHALRFPDWQCGYRWLEHRCRRPRPEYHTDHRCTCGATAHTDRHVGADTEQA